MRSNVERISDIYTSLGKLISSASICFENKYQLSGQILLYSAIDILANLNVQSEKEVAKDDFIFWVEKYILPDTDLKCSALDLYAARCGLLHSFSSSSSLSRSGKAKEIFYTWGTADDSFLESLIEADVRYSKKTTVVKMENLQSAIMKGAGLFLSEVQNDPERMRKFLERARYFFVDVPAIKDRE